MMVSAKGDDIYLKLGCVHYRIDVGNSIKYSLDDVGVEKEEAWQRTEDQIQSLIKLLNGHPNGHVILGWCVGNSSQRKSNALASTMDAHARVINAAGGNARLTVHTAAHQAKWNPEIIQRHFSDLRLKYETSSDGSGKVKETEALSQEALLKMMEDRENDAKLYRTECGNDENFDALVQESGGPIFEPSGDKPKDRHINAAAQEISGLVKRLRDGEEPDCVEFRRLLSERTECLKNLMHARRTNKGADKARKSLRANEMKLIETAARAFEADGPKAQRRAQLALHSKDVLEQTALDALDETFFPRGKGKTNVDVRNRNFNQLFSSEEPSGTPSISEFHSRILSAVCDNKSTIYMASQEYEFTEASGRNDILYVYPSDPGPFIAEDARPKVHPLIGETIALDKPYEEYPLHL